MPIANNDCSEINLNLSSLSRRAFSVCFCVLIMWFAESAMRDNSRKGISAVGMVTDSVVALLKKDSNVLMLFRVLPPTYFAQNQSRRIKTIRTAVLAATFLMSSRFSTASFSAIISSTVSTYTPAPMVQSHPGMLRTNEILGDGSAAPNLFQTYSTNPPSEFLEAFCCF